MVDQTATHTADAPGRPALTMRGMVKRFGGVTALDGVDLTIRARTVHALLGENGAGKTTLMRIAFGMIRPDAGAMTIDGTVRRFRSVAESIAAGVGMVHQHYTLVPAMTVADNVALGLHVRYNVRAVSDRIRAIGAATGLILDPAAIVSDLSVEAQQRLEIIKALARDARLLILDEPTAVLAPPAAANVLRWLRTFADGGRAVVLITHKLHEAMGVADDVTVLRRGRTVLAVPSRDASESTLADAMLGAAETRNRPPVTVSRPADGHDRGMSGESIEPPVPVGGAAAGDGGRELDARSDDRRRAPVAGAIEEGRESDTLLGSRQRAPVIAAAGVAITDSRGLTRLTDMSFAIYAGEIVGIAGVEGQGQHELLRAIAGRLPVTSGTLVVPTTIGFVPEDRQRDALVLEFPLYENVALRGAGGRRGRVPWGRVREETRQLLGAFDVRASGDEVRASTLSGGNQQKLVLARELAAEPAALVVENPTRGLDIQATASVHERLRDARARGCAVVFYASDVDEVVALADRVLVVAQRTVREVPRERGTVGREMLGLAVSG
jgi:simple sugar transport system ATP-binding protein